MEERVYAIAWYRLSRLMELHQGDAVTKATRDAQAQANRNGGRPRSARSTAGGARRR